MKYRHCRKIPLLWTILLAPLQSLSMNVVVPLFRWVVMVIQDMTLQNRELGDASDGHPELSSSHVADDVPADIQNKLRIKFPTILKGISIILSTLNGISNTISWSIPGREMWHTVVYAVFSLRTLVDTGKPSQKWVL